MQVRPAAVAQTAAADSIVCVRGAGWQQQAGTLSLPVCAGFNAWRSRKDDESLAKEKRHIRSMLANPTIAPTQGFLPQSPAKRTFSMRRA